MKIKALTPQASVDRGACAICRESTATNGQHAVLYPVALRGALVCDDCAHDHNITCECCEAGHSVDEIIASGKGA